MTVQRAIGIAVVAIGLGVLVSDWTPALSATGVQVGGVALGGIAALLGVGIVVRQRARVDAHWQPAPTEYGVLVPAPGDDLRSASESEIQERFRQQVVEALLAAGHTAADAEAAIEQGTWTTDPDAAAYLTASPAQLPQDDALARQRAAVLEALERVHRDHD